MPNRRIHALAQLAVWQIGVKQHPARVGQRGGGLIQILQRAQPDLAVGLLRPVEQITQQHVEHIEGIVMRARFQAVNKRHQRGDASRIRESGNSGDFDGVGEACQRRNAARRHMGARQFDSQATHGLDAL